MGTELRCGLAERSTRLILNASSNMAQWRSTPQQKIEREMTVR
jgi:hypothetical protein